MNGALDAQDSEGNSSFEAVPAGTISARSIGRFRSVLAPEEIRFIELATATARGTYGYPTEIPRPEMKHPLGFYGRYLPENLARLGGWMVNDVIARRRGTDVPESRLSTEGAESHE
jgi:hypothetical protein